MADEDESEDVDMPGSERMLRDDDVQDSVISVCTGGGLSHER